jgi:hypothetical protein
VALRPARLLPPKRLLTPRSARDLSISDWGLLLGSPAITQVGLAPTGLVQLSGRNTTPAYETRSTEGFIPEKLADVVWWPGGMRLVGRLAQLVRAQPSHG